MVVSSVRMPAIAAAHHPHQSIVVPAAAALAPPASLLPLQTPQLRYVLPSAQLQPTRGNMTISCSFLTYYLFISLFKN